MSGGTDKEPTSPSILQNLSTEFYEEHYVFTRKEFNKSVGNKVIRSYGSERFEQKETGGDEIEKLSEIGYTKDTMCDRLDFYLQDRCVSRSCTVI